MNRRVSCFVVLLALWLVVGAAPAQTDVLLEGRFIPGSPMAAAPGSSDLGGVLNHLVTGDVNNDGYPDIAAAHGLRVAGLYLNQGDRSFAAEHVLSEPWWDFDENTGATSIALGDLDLDGNLDMVIPIYGNHYVEHMVQLYRGRGDGTFELWPVDGYNALTDFEGVNQDGVNDGIIVARGAANPMFAGIADFNGDGRPDVVVSGNNGAWSVDVLIQSASREFSVSDSDRAGQNPQFLGLGDFNADGTPDVAAGALYNGVLVFLNDANGNGTLHQVGGTYLSSYRHLVIVADFNGDGRDDIAARGYQEARVDILYGDGTGSFPSTANFPVSGSSGYLAAVDIDNDGDKDLVVASQSAKKVDVLLNNGNGRFSPPESTYLDEAPWGVAAADFDRDGYVDVAVSRNDNTIQVLWNRGNRGKYKDCIGVWRPGTGQFLLDRNGNNKWDGPAGGDTLTAPLGPPSDNIPVTGDWNGDGADEIGWWRPGTGRFYLDRNGNNKWDGPAGGDTLTAHFGFPSDIPVTGDWNGDGTDEVGWWRPGTCRFYLDANGNHEWDGRIGGDVNTGMLRLSTDIPVTGDWNGDSTDEVGWWRPSTGRFYLDANGNHKWDALIGGDIITGILRLSTDVPVTGDWNGDGTDEVGWWRPSTGRFYLDANGNHKWDGRKGGDIVSAPFGRPTDIPVTGRWHW